MRRPALAALELLVALAVVGVLAALLLAAAGAARQAAGRAGCLSRLRQLGIAMHSFAEATGRLPADWPADLAPWCGDDPAAARCPAAPPGPGPDYAGVSAVSPVYYRAMGLAGPSRGGPLGPPGALAPGRLADVADGLSRTVLLLEDAGRPARWRVGPLLDAGASVDPGPTVAVEGAAWDGSFVNATVLMLRPVTPGGRSQRQDGRCPFGCTNDGEGWSFHLDGMNVLMADGSATAFAATMDAAAFAASCTRAAGD